MLPRAHIILGFFFAAAALYFFPQIGFLGAGLIWAGSFLIDADHYLWYVIEERDLSLKKAYKWHLMKREKMRKLSKKERRKHKNEILIFHGFESVLAAYLLSFLWQPFIYLAIGFIIHLSLDYYEEIAYQHRLDKLSVIWDTIKYHKLKKLK
ncbi:hypothetical protein GF378_03415 [Candidatus Pacearchaeota archaeon]|nr:hypothetical protein [Candidatus Pacearchaeota archaeon]